MQRSLRWSRILWRHALGSIALQDGTQPINHRLSQYSSAALLIAIFLGASIIGVMSDIYRLESKGANYSLATWNDAYYYRSMVSDLWNKPRSVGEELSASNLSPAVEVQRARNYDSSSIHAIYLHEQNGLARQAGSASPRYRRPSDRLAGSLGVGAGGGWPGSATPVFAVEVRR